jgi:membrane associated rhomboid family serine protease
MLIPYGTDAPIYYRPFATASIIMINVVMFWLTGMGEVCNVLQHEHRWLILEFNRINPLQWVTAAFMHASWGHLLGNMIFLWCFGLVVEGKLGWRKFSVLYLSLCLAKGAVTQVPMFVFWPSDFGGALGASGAIFGLMAVAICWAPENDMHCLFTWWFPFVRTFDVPIFGLGLFYLVLQLLPLLLGGFHMSTPMLHLLGMFVGFPIAIYMLKHNLVDCEGWDVISRWSHLPKSPLMLISSLVQSREKRKSGKILTTAYDRRSERDALKQILENPAAYNPPTTATFSSSAPANSGSHESAIYFEGERRSMQIDLAKLDQSIRCEDANAAKNVFQRIDHTWGTHCVAELLLAKYATLLSKQGHHLDSLQPLTVLVSRRGKYRNQACLRIARVQLQLQNDPAAAQFSIQQMVRPWNKKTDAKRERIIQALSRSESPVSPQ